MWQAGYKHAVVSFGSHCVGLDQAGGGGLQGQGRLQTCLCCSDYRLNRHVNNQVTCRLSNQQGLYDCCHWSRWRTCLNPVTDLTSQTAHRMHWVCGASCAGAAPCQTGPHPCVDSSTPRARLLHTAGAATDAAPTSGCHLLFRTAPAASVAKKWHGQCSTVPAHVHAHVTYLSTYSWKLCGKVAASSLVGWPHVFWA